MTQNEAAYVSSFRELAVKQQAIAGLIADLHSICKSLGNWRETAVLLASPAGTMRDEWRDDRIDSLGKLRKLLVEYEQSRSWVARAWSQLKEEERIGLAPPSSLDN